MSNVDELMTQFRTYVPETDPAAAQRVAQRVGEARSHRRLPARIGLTGRRVATAAAAVGVATLAAVLVVLFVASDKSSRPATPPGWGLEATVSVTPGPGGLDLGAATDRAARVLNARWRAQGLQGVEAARRETGSLRVVAAQAKRADQIENLLLRTDIRVYNPADALVDSTDPRELLRALKARANPGTAFGAYVALPVAATPLPVRPYLVTPTRDEQLGLFGGILPGGFELVGIPTGLRLMSLPRLDPRPNQRYSGSRYLLVEEQPVLRAEDLIGARAGGPNVFLETASAARTRLAAASARTAPAPGLILVSVTGVQSDVIGLVRPGGPDWSLRIDQSGGAAGASQLAALFAAGGVTATFSVTATTQFGNAPAIIGDPAPTLPPEIEATLGKAPFAGHPPPGSNPSIPRDAVRRVLTTRAASDDFELYAAHAGWGEDFFWLARTPLTRSNGVARVGPQGTCDPEPGRPAITSCASVGDSVVPHTLGRVGPGVTRVEARYAGRAPAEAAVTNGWFLLFLDPDPQVVPVEIVALDAGGQVVGRLTPDEAALAPPRTPSPPSVTAVPDAVP